MHQQWGMEAQGQAVLYCSLHAQKAGDGVNCWATAPVDGNIVVVCECTGTVGQNVTGVSLAVRPSAYCPWIDEHQDEETA